MRQQERPSRRGRIRETESFSRPIAPQNWTSVCCPTPSNAVALSASCLPSSSTESRDSFIDTVTCATHIALQTAFQNDQEGRTPPSALQPNTVTTPRYLDFDLNPSTCRGTLVLSVLLGRAQLAGVAQPPERKPSTDHLRACCWYVISALCMPRRWVRIGRASDGVVCLLAYLTSVTVESVPETCVGHA